MVLRPSALLAFCFVLSLFYTSVVARTSHSSHPRPNSEICGQLLERKEWRALSDGEKKSYIDAVRCLQMLPAHNTSRSPSWTRFDEFQATHVDMAASVHWMGQFLPWHRLFVKSYETALRNECGYEGAQPYWDWSIDADLPNLISKSPIWDPIIGFGGDGVPGTYTVPTDPAGTSRILPSLYHGCVEDGPFAGYSLKLGPGLFVTEHCITRGINDTKSIWLNSSAIAYVSSFPTFDEFRVKLEGIPWSPVKLGPHGGGHGAVGGEMSNFYSSPGDPIFYMHHASLDRIWWRWQEACPERLYEVDGPTSITPPYGHLTLDYPLKMGNIGPTLPVREVMDIRCDPSCYIYV